ncbi:GNAT family N-acetyltransferase [Haliscomenobacter hydrossis]|uniref:GCN5-related N-acetyltransferase n=1 Tax=Haliscomenobacter hydrossis (strain ATCC 27775 / DSM 1100 / LMG 10767 / O) TaxID=760192 RepID=F4L6T7_HALH1|nr:GNAT family N-acetyltransferase [Haliscomenobacter hydrossis]AEE50918.1 GCN5-related N-acetyltransferase [Haliscomenobacter hydrossis DSM 1100]
MIRIERVFPKDILTLQKVVKETYLPYFRYLWHDEGKAYLAAMNDLFVLNQHLQNPFNQYYFACNEQGEILGYLKIILFAPVPEEDLPLALCIDKLYLYEAARGKGIGKALMNFAETKAREEDPQINCLWLRVMDSNPYNLDFYAKHGFNVLHKRWLDLPQMKEEYRGILTMVKKI